MFHGGFGIKIEIASHHCHLKLLLDSDVYGSNNGIDT